MKFLLHSFNPTCLMLERHHSSRIRLVHGVVVVWKLIDQKELLELEYRSTDHYSYVQLQYHESDVVKRDVEIETVGECVDEIDKLAELIGKHEADQEDR
ncbi:hypothetical protein Tco_1358342, partial [Tanacetum coccineum]